MSDIAIEPGAHGVALSGAPLPLFDVPVSQPWGPSPLRRPGSVRRTMTLDATWPDGQDGDVIFAGDARDIVTEWQGGGPVPKPAIVATAPVVGASEEETSYAVGTITVFGLLALVVYPFLSHALFSGDGFAAGIFLGTAIHDTAQVAGAEIAGLVEGPGAILGVQVPAEHLRPAGADLAVDDDDLGDSGATVGVGGPLRVVQ